MKKKTVIIINSVKIDELFGVRKGRRYTQQDVAKMIGYKDKNTYGRIEKGEKCPTLDEAKRIAKALGVKMNQIFDMDEGGENERSES
jgi:DNA-binding XRE family transcriptional regulator